MAEIRDVPREVIREFSRRRIQVEERLEDGGGFYAAQLAAHETRGRKEQVDLVQLRETWRARAAEHGLGEHVLAALLGRARHRDPSADELLALARRMLGPQGLTEKRTAFSDPEAVMAWAEAHDAGASSDRIRRLATRLTATDGVVAVGERPSPGRPARYSTAELV
jgi:hypothetical protein